MQLTRLVEAFSDILGWAGGHVEVYGITADPQQVRPGDLFVAIPGTDVDDPCRISEALMEGAVAVVGEQPPEELSDDLPWGAFTYVHVLSAREAWGWLRETWEGLAR